MKMKSMILVAMAAMTFGFGSISAQAGEMGPYAGLQTGLYNISNDVGAWNGSDQAFGSAAILGYDSGSNISAELRVGFTNDAKYNLAGVNTKTKLGYTVSYLLKPYTSVDLGPKVIDIYGLIGATTARVNYSAAGWNANTTVTGVSYGAGASVPLMDNVDVGAEWLRLLSNKSTGVNRSITVDSFALTGVYHF